MSGRRLLEGDGSVTVDVSFNVPTAAKTDRIAAYCSSDVANVADTEYVDFQSATGAASGTLTFGPILNMRCNYQFQYQKNLGNKTFATVAEPLQAHISLTSQSDEISVMWTSAEVKGPSVCYYIKPANGTATYTSISATNVTSAQRYIPSGIHYKAIIKKIPAGATVVYQVGSAVDGWSDDKQFVMPNLKSRDPSSFFVFGDLGTWVTATNGTGVPGRSLGTISRVADDLAKGDRNYQAVLHVGDLSYADSVGYIWEQFHSLIEPVASKIPYLVSVGNHEYCYLTSTKAVDISGETKSFFPAASFAKASSNGECGVPTATRFSVPDNSNNVFWYSFNSGLTHQVVVSSEHDFFDGSRLRKWLEANLAAVDRTEHPWVIVHGHRPMYVSMESSFAYTAIFRAAVEPVLNKYNVDIFSGHTHAYERTQPVYNETVQVGSDGNALGTAHIMIGSAGKELDTDAWVNTTWSAKQLRTYGYGRLHVENASHALFEYVLNSDASVADSVCGLSRTTSGVVALNVNHFFVFEIKHTDNEMDISPHAKCDAS
ncbi:hypothetical protein AeRB84_009714 [Aphanomyces euteiches]|nr:hypothetical protein AeRB84_009714 [Aphanomyces euteiches]